MYVDTSVAVKLFVPEPDSDSCELVIGGSGFVSSELLMGELFSAFLAKERGGQISPEARERAWDRFDSLLGEGYVRLVPLNGIIVRAAADIMNEVHPEVPLRTLDAIHLASFLSVEAGPLFTRDKRMLAAARRLNLPLAGT